MSDDWKLAFPGWDPDRELLREALSTLGNGYFATRGAMEESVAGDHHYPGTYLASGYNRLETDIAGRVIENEDLVNWPNWLYISFRPEGGEWLNVETMELLELRRELDIKRGILERHLRVRDKDGRETSLVSRRLVHMGNPHLAAVEWVLTPENWSGALTIRSALDGMVINAGVPRYRELASRHLKPICTERFGEESILLHVRTTQSQIRMALGARHRLFSRDAPAPADRRTVREQGYIAQELTLPVEERHELRFEKIVAIHTSRDKAISDELSAVRTTLERAGSFEALCTSHELKWAQLWERCDIRLEEGNGEQMILRLHIFHLLQTVSLNTIPLDAGVPARGLHGEAYRGHIFWDELFIFPFFTLRLPELTRSLLIYRYRRLDEARFLAHQAGLCGAMYPWQSGSTGREESQVLHLNPKSGRWLPDHTYLQRHINMDIAWNVWEYYQATEDREFLSFYGAVMFLEITRFCACLTTWCPEKERFEIRGVVGPDEYHTSYPDSDTPGIDNNAFTNVMVAWTLGHAERILKLLPRQRCDEIRAELGITEEEIRRWDEISRCMYIPFVEEGLIFEQFEGYDKLQELDWEAYRNKYGDIHRLDRILEAEGDTVDRYKVAKQADALMLFYLFSEDELGVVMDRLGYPLKPDAMKQNVDYYLHRTSHGSTLSGVVNAWVLSRLDQKRSWDYFADALRSDLLDVQGGTTPEGIHLGAMAGTVDLVQRCFTGFDVREDALWFDPRLPEALKSVNLDLRYRGHWLNVTVTQEKLIIVFEEGWTEQIRIGFRDELHEFRPGDRKEFILQRSPDGGQGA